MYEVGVAVWWNGELHYSKRKMASSPRVDDLYNKLCQALDSLEEPVLEPGTKCGMKDCERDAIKILQLFEHLELRAMMGLPEKVVKLPCCLEHTLQWEIGWLFGDYDIGVTPKLIGELVFRAIAEAGERLRDAMI